MVFVSSKIVPGRRNAEFRKHSGHRKTAFCLTGICGFCMNTVIDSNSHCSRMLIAFLRHAAHPSHPAVHAADGRFSWLHQMHNWSYVKISDKLN